MASELNDSEAVRAKVREGYGQIAKAGSSCCGPAKSCCGGGNAQLVASQVIALAHFLLNGALDIGECVLGIAPARPFERLLKEAHPVMVANEPGPIEGRSIHVRNMSEAHRQALIEALGE